MGDRADNRKEWLQGKVLSIENKIEQTRILLRMMDTELDLLKSGLDLYV